jgi:transposase
MALPATRYRDLTDGQCVLIVDLLAQVGAPQRRSRPPVAGEPCRAQWCLVDPEDRRPWADLPEVSTEETRAPHWDASYESDQLDAELAQQGVELIAPHRSDRKRKTQDGRPLRRYRRRWKVERLFAWLQNYRRVVVRYERHPENFLGMLHLACCLILLRCL